MFFIAFPGGYMFGLGVGTYLISKEIYIMEHEYYAGLSLFIVLCGGYYKFYNQIHGAIEKRQNAQEQQFKSITENDLKTMTDSIKDAEKQKWITGVQSMIMEAKKENVAMQLEAAYRERVAQVYSEVN